MIVRKYFLYGMNLYYSFLCRYGGQAANFTADDLTQSPGEQDFDLQDLMRKLSTTDKEESQKSDQATVKEDGDNTGKFKAEIQYQSSLI